jgi:hypothetical protein
MSSSSIVSWCGFDYAKAFDRYGHTRMALTSADSLAVIVHVIMNELFKPRPVLLIQTGNVASVDIGQVGSNYDKAAPLVPAAK